MPTCLEHWLTMAPTTCYGYKRRYHDIDTLKKQIIIHGKNAGVIIADKNDGPVLSMDDFIKVSPKILSRKRPRIEQPMAQTQDAVLVPMVQAQAQQPMADAALVPMVQAQAQQPMADAALVPMVQAQAQQPMAQAQVPMIDLEQPMAQTAEQPMAQAQVPMQEADATDSTSATEISPPSAHFPNANGARKPLVLNGITIEVDPVTFMVNATQMCKAGGKLYANYSSSIGMTEYIYALSSVIGIPITELTVSNQGGRPELQGTMVHRRVALYLAQRISPVFAVQVTGWLEELRNENATLSTQIEDLQRVVEQHPGVVAQRAIAPICCTNTNGARRVVPTKPLVLNGFTIEVDPDTFMVNATMMCKAAGKLFGHYWQLDSTKIHLRELSSDIGIPITELVIINQGGRADRQGTCVHFRLALHLAYWLSTEVQVQFSKWIAELLLTGRVELGNEMNVQQLEDVWKRRIEEGEAKAAMDLDAEQDRCRKLELRLATIQEARQQFDEENRALVAIKTREDLEAAVQFQARATAPTISSYKEGDNVLYLARIDGTKFKYGCSKNVGRRFDTHRRPGVYPTFEPIGVLPCSNAVASEDQVRAYVKKTNIGVEYGTQREIVVLESVDALQRMMNKMQKCCRQRPASEGSEVLLRRNEVKASIKMKKIDARVDMEKIKAELEEKKIAAELDEKKIAAGLEEKKMDVGEKNKDREMKKLQMVLDGLIDFDQFLLIK